MNIEEILIFDPALINTQEQKGLMWCETVFDVKAAGQNAVCLASGAKWEQLQYCTDWLKQFEYVFVLSKNREFIDNIRTHILSLPILVPQQKAFGGYKTVSELLEALGPDGVGRLFFGAEMEPIYGLINLADVKARDLSKVRKSLSGIKALDNAIGGFYAGAMSVWTGKTGEGKTTFLGSVLLEAIDQGHKVCAYSGELPKDQFKEWELGIAAGTEFMDGIHDPDTGEMLYIVREEVTERINKWLDKKFFLVDIGTAKAHDEDFILSCFEYAYRYYGCDVFLVDNLMTVNMKNKSDYYQAQSELAIRLSKFAKETQTHVHLVAHPRKTQNGKSIDSNEEVSGSNNITNIADNVFAVARAIEKYDGDGNPRPLDHNATITITKSRVKGKKGKIKLMFDEVSSRFYPLGGSPNKTYGWDKTGLERNNSSRENVNEQEYDTGGLPF